MSGVVLVVLVVLGIVGATVGRSALANNKVVNVGASSMAMGIAPGQILDVALLVTNNGDSAVTLRGASIIDVPGFKPAKLVHLGVYKTMNIPVGTTGWKPLLLVDYGKTTTQTYVTYPLNGYVLGSHRTVYLVYAMAGQQGLGLYGAAGLHLTYSYRHLTGHSTAWGGGADCMTPIHVNVCSTYTGAGGRILDYINKVSR